MRYEIVRREFAGQEMDLVRIPRRVWKEALAADTRRQAWHGHKPKANHWAGKGEQVLGNAGELMLRLMLKEFGVPEWQVAPLFNPTFDRSVDRGGSPPWDVAFARTDEWKTIAPGHKPGWFGVPLAGEVKTTGCGRESRDAWVLRVKDEEFKPHPRLVFFATMMVSLRDPALGWDRRTRRIQKLPKFMLPFHYITNCEVEAVPPTPEGEPFAPYKSCRVFPFPGFRWTARKVTGRTSLGPELKPITRDTLLSLIESSTMDVNA